MSSLGIKLPLEYSTADGYQMLKTIPQLIRQNFKMLLLTNPGERIMAPSFGIGVKRFLFLNYGEGMEAALESRIKEQVSIYLPTVQIVTMQFIASPDSNTMSLKIMYNIAGLGMSDSLNVTI
jgi:phage baseplate assembly protein W